MSGRLVVITGGTRGIGLAISRRFVDDGDSVLMTYLTNRTAAHKALDGLGRDVDVSVIRADNANRDDMQRLSETIRATGRPLHALVASATSGVFGAAMTATEAHWRWSLDLQVYGLLLQAQFLVPLMPSSGGKIVAISSIGASRAVANYALLGTAKGALESMVRHLADELGRSGTNVNCVQAGLVETDALKQLARSKGIVGWVRARTPVGRLTTGEDIANVVYFLCGPDATMIQGQTIVVDGGYSIKA